jgi:hypothetical protein
LQTPQAKLLYHTMKSPLGVFALLLGLAVLEAPAQTVVQGEPFGYVKLTVTNGTGTGKRTTMLSIPLLDSVSIGGQSQGALTGVGGNTLSNANANWTPGELSAVTNRFLVEMTSGAGAGRMLLIATNSNTPTAVTIQASDVSAAGGNLSTLGIAAGDKYRIRPVDTLRSFFGTPATTGIVGGTTPAGADTILVFSNGNPITYFYHSTSNRWVQNAPGLPDASHTPIPPYVGIQYSRIGAQPLVFVTTGRVPWQSNRVVPIRNGGSTLVSQYWPVATAISNLGFQNMSGWARGTNTRTADRILVSTSPGTTARTYFFHSISNAWVESAPGTPLRGNVIVPVGSSITVTRASNASGFSSFIQPVPYNLQ